MCYIQLSKKCIVWLIIISVLFVYIEPPAKVYAEPVTLATAWGGTTIAKEVLALVVALAGAGVTIATQSDAWQLYNDLKTNNQSLLNQIISVQPQVWTGAYNEVTTELNNIKDGIVTWLTGLSGTLQEGENIKFGEIPEFPLGQVQLNVGSIVYMKAATPDDSTYKDYKYKFYMLSEDQTSTHWVARYEYIATSISNGMVYIQTTGVFTTPYGQTHSNYYPGHPNYWELVYDTELIIPEISDITYHIANNAPALNPEWDPDEDRRYLPPPWLPSFGRYPKEKIKDVPTPTGGTQRIYDGDIEEYLEDITNNATWSEIDQYIKTGANTTTLTPTAEGTLEVGEVITDGLPYPDIATDSPVGVLEGLGAIGGLIQGLINWLSRIYNAILAIPEAIASLFIPETNPFSANLTEINNNVNERIGNPAAGYVNLFQPIQAIPIPDLIYKDNIILHASFVNDSAETIRNWQRYLWTVILILLGLNNIYKLIRGTDLITIKGQHGKGWSSNGN